MPYAEPPPPRTVRVAGGRDVGYYEFGDPAGIPLFALHGTPASGAAFTFTDEAARNAGVRILAPDRPGIGLSDPLPREGPWSVADYGDELVATADALSVEDLLVIGHSGGGPYALAAAWRAPERVRAVAVVAGSGEVGSWAQLRDFEITDRTMTRISMRAPFVARTLLSLSARASNIAPGAALKLSLLGMPKVDRDIMQRFATGEAALALYTQAFLRGAAGVVDDYAALGRQWGFDVDDIVVPLRCFHGEQDTIVPPQHSVDLAARVRGASHIEWSGGGHLAIADHINEVIDWVTRTATRSARRADEHPGDAAAH